MEKQQEKNATKIGAYTTFLGSICMLTGAAVWAAAGVDIDQALNDGNIAGYLKDALASQNLLIVNLSLWIVGVILLGVGANMMSMLNRQRPVLSQLIRYNYAVAIPLVVVSYMAWLAVVVRLGSSPSPEAAAIAEAIGWFATHADWVATVLVLSTGSVLISTAGKDIWVPNWLRIWSYIVLLAGVLNVIAQYTGGLTTYGFLIIPIGMGWMFAAAITLFRRTSLSDKK